jgi:ornithine carbamoyltransferase
MKRDYLRSSDLDAETMQEIFDVAALLKERTRRGIHSRLLSGKSAALIFQKPSLRTRVTFDLALKQLDAHPIYLGPTEISIGVRESVHDVARNLERWVDLIIARVFAQSLVDELAEVAEPPVINGLSDDEHPCQAMADYFTLYEKGLGWSDIHLCYIGDGNNVCSSLMIIAAKLGVDFRVAGPRRYLPSKELVEQANGYAQKSGAKILVTEDSADALRGANAVYTDIWASMGKEEEARERRGYFEPYQVNAKLMKMAEKGAFVMHDLPAHRGEEITDEVMDSPESIVFDQAENRLHAQKAIILKCMGKLAEAKREATESVSSVS